VEDKDAIAVRIDAKGTEYVYYLSEDSKFDIVSIDFVYDASNSASIILMTKLGSDGRVSIPIEQLNDDLEVFSGSGTASYEYKISKQDVIIFGIKNSGSQTTT
jgi:hypothetical protein